MACKEEKKVMVYYLGELSDHESSDFQSHLQTCMTCQNVLTELEDTHHLLNLRPSIRSPKNLAKACMHHVEQDAFPDRLYRKKENRPVRLFPFSVPVLRWAAVVVIFCCGLLMGRLIFSPPKANILYSDLDQPHAYVDQRQIHNYLLGVETLLLQLSNLDYKMFVDKEDWTLHSEMAQKMLIRNRQIKGIAEKEDPLLFSLLVEIEWVLEDVVGTSSAEMVEMASDIQQDIDESRVLSKIHHFIS